MTKPNREAAAFIVHASDIGLRVYIVVHDPRCVTGPLQGLELGALNPVLKPADSTEYVVAYRGTAVLVSTLKISPGFVHRWAMSEDSPNDRRVLRGARQ